MSPGEDAKDKARRDFLLKNEAEVRHRWEEANVFESEACETPPGPGQKFFGTFPFPYMNGELHLGHAFSLSKVEFAAAYHRLRGANVLMPFGFHCTGMPIKASADKIKREIEKYDDPPKFPDVVETQQEEPGAEDADAEPGKYKSKKSKARSKQGGPEYQWNIMKKYGYSDSKIRSFKDPEQWLNHFPPEAVEDLKAFGLGCDWRRSFVTTDINPYFDSFVRWQIRKLKSSGKIVKDRKYVVYSPLDRQPCGDHDRASGEGVGPQEYTLIKMEVIPPYPAKFKDLEGKNRVYLAAATLRPETMYGQTNAWVLPDGKYGAFEVNETDVFIITERAARNLSYQSFSLIPEKENCLVELTGYDLIGLQLRSPLAITEKIYVLPMLSISTEKGTGIVTSVPSDAPADYMAMLDLKSKPGLRAQYGVKDEWVLPFEIVPIINIPEYGDKAAEKVCIDLKIKSQNDKVKLEEAKRLAYKKGFTEGKMLVGVFKDSEVKEVKPLIKKMLIEAGDAIAYHEPEKLVKSRSGDKCVVALTDQWFVKYGEPEWRKSTEECLANMNLYSEETKHGFEHSLSWLTQWACSRSFGLGTQFPGDEDYLVDSLSDSTIYMAYYTIAHLLHDSDMYGSSRGSVKPDQLTDEVWDYLFCGGTYPESTKIDSSIIEKMKSEFEYWYPFDLRVSGKELIRNHLTFCIYNHTAIMNKRHWPRAFRCNGHIMLNAEKMSKSTGNFMTIRKSIEKFSADATRFSLADAGDGGDDANFVCETANAAIIRLTNEISWMEKILAAESSLRTGPLSTYADKVFANEINIAVKMTAQNYEACMFREALKTGFYDLQAARDEYRFSCGTDGMNRDLVWPFMDVQTRLITPICPHYAEYVWRRFLKKDGFVVNAGWPVADQPDLTLKHANKYLQDTIILMRTMLQKQFPGSKKGSKKVVCEKSFTLFIYVNEQYDGWKAECLEILRSQFRTEIDVSVQQVYEAICNSGVGNEIGQNANFKRTCMPFLKFKKAEAVSIGEQALNLTLAFGEMEVLQENLGLIKKQLGLERVEVLSAANPDDVAKAGPMVYLLTQNPPSPGSPTAIFRS